MSRRIHFITVLLAARLSQAVEFNLERLDSQAEVFAQAINDEEGISQERVEKTISSCLLRGKPYRYGDLYLDQKSASKIYEQKKFLTDTFKHFNDFFKTCSDIYNNDEINE